MMLVGDVTLFSNSPSLGVTDCRVKDKSDGRIEFNRHTIIPNEMNRSSVSGDAQCVILHPRASADVS